MQLDTDTDTIDDAADTLRFIPNFDSDFDSEVPTDPDATAIYDLRPATPPRYVGRSGARRRQIRASRMDIAGLRDALAAGWDVGLELAHEERRLAALESASRRFAEGD